MSILSTKTQVDYDVENPQHRRYFQTFMRNQAWGTTPVRFTLRNYPGDVIARMTKITAEYYLNQEFGNTDR